MESIYNTLWQIHSEYSLSNFIRIG